jgi:hypothetical protein
MTRKPGRAMSRGTGKTVRSPKLGRFPSQAGARRLFEAVRADYRETGLGWAKRDDGRGGKRGETVGNALTAAGQLLYGAPVFVHRWSPLMPHDHPSAAWCGASRAVRNLERKLSFLARNTLEESLHCPRSLESLFTQLQEQINVYQSCIDTIRDELASDVRWKPLGNHLGEQLGLYLPLVQRILEVDVAGVFWGDDLPASDCELRLRAAGRAIRRLSAIIRHSATASGILDDDV